MLVDVLPTEERLTMHATHRMRVFASDLTEAAANTAQVLNLMPVSVGMRVSSVTTKLLTSFQELGTAAFNTTAITVGDSAAANTFVASQECNHYAATPVQFKQSSGGKIYTAADNVTLTVNAMAGYALSSLNAGELHVFIELVDVNGYDAPVNAA